jgi:hypothetical protein
MLFLGFKVLKPTTTFYLQPKYGFRGALHLRLITASFCGALHGAALHFDYYAVKEASVVVRFAFGKSIRPCIRQTSEIVSD